MKKALILSAFVFTSVLAMAQSSEPHLHAKTRVLKDSTTLLIDSSENMTQNGNDAKMIKSAAKSDPVVKSKNDHHSSATFRRRNGML